MLHGEKEEYTQQFHYTYRPGVVAPSDARLPGMRTVTGLILTSGKTFFHWDLVMK